MRDSVEAQDNLADDLVEVLNKHSEIGTLTYATIIGTLDILKDMLLDELRDSNNEQDTGSNSIFKAIAKAGNGRADKGNGGDEASLP